MIGVRDTEVVSRSAATHYSSIDADLPGVTSSGTIVVEQVGPGNSTLAEFTVDTEPKVATVTGKEHELARVAFDRGFYRIHVGGSPASVPVTVGDPSKIAAGYADDLRDQANRLSAHAEQVREYQQTGRFEPLVATTDADGRFALSIRDSNVERVGLVAYRARTLNPSTRNSMRSSARTTASATATKPCWLSRARRPSM